MQRRWLLVVGLFLYIIRRLPIDAWIKEVAYVVVVVFMLIWLLQIFGFDIRIPIRR